MPTTKEVEVRIKKITDFCWYKFILDPDENFR